MTIESTTFRTAWLAGDGVTTEWPYAFTIYSDDTIVVLVRDSAGTIVEHTSNFTWLRTNDTSGNVKYPVTGSAVPTGSHVRIERRLNYLQPTAIGNQGAFYPVVHERAFDTLTMRLQQVNDKADRSLILPVDDPRDPTDVIDDIFAAETAAAASAAAAAASYDSFDDRYLGAKAADPALDNDGNALLTGAIYWNTTDSRLRLYSGSAWDYATIDPALYVPKAGGAFTGDVIVPSLNGGPLAGLRNKIINGLGTINQRSYVSGAATSTANQYTVDRWYVLVSGQSLSWTESANVRTFTAPAGGVGQKIEGASIQSGTHVLSWTGTATATVNGVAVANGGTFTLTGGTDATLVFSSGTFSKPQIEPGTVASPFEQRPAGLELALCQRYYEKGFAQSYVAVGSVTQVTLSVSFKTTKRAAPSVTVPGTVPFAHNASAITSEGFTAGCSGSGAYVNTDWTADAEL